MVSVAEENTRFMEARAKAAEEEMRSMSSRFNIDLAGVERKVDEMEKVRATLLCHDPNITSTNSSLLVA